MGRDKARSHSWNWKRGVTMQVPANELTEKQLAEDFDRVQREVAEQIRKYEEAYPELARHPHSGDEVVRQPVYAYEIHAVS